MLPLLTNIRSTKVLWYDAHHPITTFSIEDDFGSQTFLQDRNLAIKYHTRQKYGYKPRGTKTCFVFYK